MEAHRTGLEMQHRVTPVTFGLRGRTCGERYRAVRYEDFCADPIAQGADLFAFVDVPFLQESRAAKSVNRTRIGTGRHLPREETEVARG